MDLQTLIQYQLSEGLTEKELAAAIGVPTFTIHGVLKGRKPKNPEILRKLAGYFRVDLPLARTGNLSGEPSRELEGDPEDLPPLQPYRKVPLLAWRQIREVVVESAIVSRLSPHQKMIETELSGGRIFVLPVPDDSMEPLFHKGELFFVNPDLEAAVGDYVVVLDQMAKGNPGCLRQLKRRAKRYVLHALNRHYKDTPLTGHQKVIGRVVRLRMNL